MWAMSSDSDFPGKLRSIALLTICEVGVVSLWFSATAIIPSLVRQYGMAAADLYFLTSATQTASYLAS